MSERTSLWPKNTSQEHQHIQIIDTIGKRALEVVDHIYGSGFPDWEPGQHERSFHNGRHGRAVGDTALRLCATLRLSPTKQAIAQTAGFAHDIVYRQKRGQDEAESAAWLDEQLAKAEAFPPQLRQIGTLAILGTVPLFKDGVLVEQRASTLEYPSEDAELIAKSVASSDLGVLYTPEGPYQSHQFLRELKGGVAPVDISPEDMINFQRTQVALLETYRYPLKEADTILATHRSQVMKYTEQQLQRMEREEIESWDQLIKDDMAFFLTHS